MIATETRHRSRPAIGRRLCATARVIALAAVVATFATACEKEVQVEPPPIRPVYSHRVAAASATTARSFSGVVTASEGVDLGFEVAGRIVSIVAEAGLHYEKGTVLARIDTTGYQAELKNAQAQFAAADAGMRRTLRLYESENASKAQLDSAIASHEAAEAALDIARKRLEDCTLRMPYDGAIGDVMADPQQVMSAGAPVAAIQGAGLLEMEIGVPADVVDQIQLGLAASIRLGIFPDRVYPARVTEISPQIASNTTYPVTVTFDENGKGVREGLDGEATLELPNPHGKVVKVPSPCVAGSSESGTYVWLIEPQSGSDLALVKKRSVRIGAVRAGGMLEIIDGLVGDELIVSRGVNRLHEGESVRLSSPNAR